MVNKGYRFGNEEVVSVFKAYPPSIRKKVMFLRELILDTAAKTEGVGNLQETLKWGQPSYVTVESKSGSTIRIDRVNTQSNQYAIYFHCQTTLVDTFKEMFGKKFKYQGNRAIIFDEQDKVPIKELIHCIALALTYHKIRKSEKR